MSDKPGMRAAPRWLATAIALAVGISCVVALLALRARKPAAPGTPPPPADELALCAAVEAHADKYAQASVPGNGAALTALREARRAAIARVDHADGTATAWFGTVDTLTTTDGGKLGVVIRLPCSDRVWIRTWGTAAADAQHATLIDPSAPLHAKLAAMSNGNVVTFSGRFLIDPQDHWKQTANAESEAMREPQFLFRFADITKL